MPKDAPRPIDHVPAAGARSGHANGAETTEAGLRASDANLEDGEGTLSPQRSPGPSRGRYDPILSPKPAPLNYMPGSQDSPQSPSTPVLLVPSSQIPAVSL
jgi:hypothetical protein